MPLKRSRVGSCWAYLPAANAEQKAHNIALLLLRELLEILVGAHLCRKAESAIYVMPIHCHPFHLQKSTGNRQE